MKGMILSVIYHLIYITQKHYSVKKVLCQQHIKENRAKHALTSLSRNSVQQTKLKPSFVSFTRNSAVSVFIQDEGFSGEGKKNNQNKIYWMF